MADENWKNHPIVAPGPGTGEYIVNIPPGGGDPLVAQPGQSAQQQAAETTFDAMRAGANTGTFGTYDRAAGGINALTGAAPDYTTGVNEQVKLSEAARARSPVATTLADIGTGAAGGLGLARAGVTAVPYLASRLGRTAAGVGEASVLGGLEGAGKTYTGNPGDYFANYGEAAVYGAPFGILGMGTGAAGEGAYRGIASTRGVPARLAEAGATDAAGLREIIAGTRGPRAMLPDAGPAMTGTAQGAVLDPLRPGAAALLSNLRLRNESSAPYIDQSLNQIFGRAPVPSQVQRDIVQPQIAALSPLYQDAYRNARAVNTAPIANWLETQVINTRGQAQTQMQRLRDALDMQGIPGALDPHPRTLGAVRSDVKGLLQTGELQPNTRRLLEEADRRMTAELQTSVPGIRDLDARRAELGAQTRALETGSPGSRMFDKARETVIRPDELQDIMTAAARPKGSMTYTEEPLRLRQAARAELDRVVGTSKNDLLALENLLAQPQDWNSQKLAVMFGQDRADRIAGILRNERAQRDVDTAVRGGSQTATRLAAQKAQDAQSGRLPLDLTLTGGITRGASWLKDKLFQAQAAAQRDRIAGFMAPANPAEVQAAARQLLAVQPERSTRAALVRTMMQGGGRGAGAGFVPKDYRMED